MRKLAKKQNPKQTRSAQTRKTTRKPGTDAHPLLQLQRTIGNQAVLRLLRSHDHNLSNTHSNGAETDVPPIVYEALQSPGQPMSDGTREFMESRFEQDFSGVRVHTGEMAAEAAESVNANAFTVGRDIVFGEGQFAPNTSEGQRLLTHELTHTVQQTSGSTTSGSTTAGAVVQRDPQTDKEVKAVKSGNVTLRENEVKTAETQLAKRMAKRQA